MNTEQNYVGGGDYATPTEQTATPNPQTDQNQVQRAGLDNFKSKYEESLRALLIESGHFANAKDELLTPIRAISTILQHWIVTQYKTLARTCCDEDMAYHDEVIEGALDVMEYVVKVTACYEEAYSWQKQIKEAEKEVGRA